MENLSLCQPDSWNRITRSEVCHSHQGFSRRPPRHKGDTGSSNAKGTTIGPPRSSQPPWKAGPWETRGVKEERVGGGGVGRRRGKLWAFSGAWACTSVPCLALEPVCTWPNMVLSWRRARVNTCRSAAPASNTTQLMRFSCRPRGAPLLRMAQPGPAPQPGILIFSGSCSRNGVGMFYIKSGVFKMVFLACTKFWSGCFAEV